jgi:hypothetical protein
MGLEINNFFSNPNQIKPVGKPEDVGDRKSKLDFNKKKEKKHEPEKKSADASGSLGKNIDITI